MIGPIPYIGGKNRLAGEIVSRIPSHTIYTEVFAGAGHVFFRKEPSKVEVLNDLDHEIVTLYRVLQSHYEELVRYMRFTIVSRHWFALLRATDPSVLTDIQRAARFFYLQKNAFGGLVVNQNFHYGVTKPSNFNPARIPEVIAAAHERLSRAQIESLPYEEALEKYDRSSAFHFLDPPYWRRKLYKFNFTDADFVALEERLRSLKGRFMLSLDDHPNVREIFKRFHIDRKEICYTAQRQAGRRYGELLISNFKPAAIPKTAA
jgi:DNA adenine methylase